MPNRPPICHFCGDPIDPRGLHRHHLNHDHGDNRPENVVDSHPSCHLSYHGRMRDVGDRELRRLELLLTTLSPREQEKMLKELSEETKWQLTQRAMDRVEWPT